MTVSTTPNQASRYPTNETERQRAFNMMISIAVVLLIVIVSAAVARGQADAILFGSLVPPAIIVWQAYRAKRGALLSSFIIVSAIVYLLFFSTIVVTAGVGIVQALFAFIMLFGLASQTLPQYLLRIGTLLAGASTALIMQELFWPVIRTVIPTSEYNILLVTSVISAVVFLVLIFQRYRDYSLQVKFVLAVTMLAIISIIITVIFVSITISQSLTAQVGQNLNAVAHARGLSIGEYFVGELQLLQTLSSDRNMQFAMQRANDSYAGLSQSDVRLFLLEEQERWVKASELERNLFGNVLATLSVREFAELFPHNVEIVVVDRFGGMLAQSGNPEQYYYGDEAWFIKAYSSGIGSRYISAPYVLERERFDPKGDLEIFDTGRTILGVDVAIPIVFRGENNNRFVAVGAVKATVSLDELWDQLGTADEVGGSGEIDLILGNSVVNIRDELLTFQPLENAEELKSRLLGTPYIIDVYEGDMSLVAGSPIASGKGETVIEKLPWVVVVHQNQSDALLLVAEQQRTQILVGVAIVLIASIAATIVGRLVATPVLELAKTAERFTAGDRTARAQATTGDELAELAYSFNLLADQVQENEQFLEQRVNDRTRALETTARISRSLSTIIDQDELVLAVVQQIQEAFNYYHVHIYLMSSDGRRLELAGGTGTAGQQLLAQKHSLPLGVGLVGRAANTNTAVHVPDVSQDHTWKANPLLPDTRAEIAMPIALGQRVLGVLDVQNREANSLGEQDVSLLQSIANQVAVGLRNAELYTRAQHEAEREQLINEIGQKIQRTNDMEDALRVAIYELGTALKQAPTAVKLYKETTNHDG